jgi:hypothetical protein
MIALGIGISELGISGISQTGSGQLHIRSPEIVKCDIEESEAVATLDIEILGFNILGIP